MNEAASIVGVPMVAVPAILVRFPAAGVHTVVWKPIMLTMIRFPEVTLPGKTRLLKVASPAFTWTTS